MILPQDHFVKDTKKATVRLNKIKKVQANDMLPWQQIPLFKYFYNRNG